MLLSGRPPHTAKQITRHEHPNWPQGQRRVGVSRENPPTLLLKKKNVSVSSIFLLSNKPTRHKLARSTCTLLNTQRPSKTALSTTVRVCELLKSNKAVLCPADKRHVYQRGRPLHKYVGSSYYKLCPWQRTNSWGKKCYMAGMDKGHFQPGWSDTSPWAVPGKAVYLTHRRERERESWHSKPPALCPPSNLSLNSLSLNSLSLSLWWHRLRLGTISLMLRKGHQLPHDTLHYLPPVSSTTSPRCPAWLCQLSHQDVSLMYRGTYLLCCHLCMFEIRR